MCDLSSLLERYKKRIEKCNNNVRLLIEYSISDLYISDSEKVSRYPRGVNSEYSFGCSTVGLTSKNETGLVLADKEPGDSETWRRDIWWRSQKTAHARKGKKTVSSQAASWPVNRRCRALSVSSIAPTRRSTAERDFPRAWTYVFQVFVSRTSRQSFSARSCMFDACVEPRRRMRPSARPLPFSSFDE